MPGSNFTALIQAQLDTSKIKSQLAGLTKSLNTTVKIKNFTLDTRGLHSQIQQALSGKSFTLKLTNVDVGTLSSTITGRLKSVGSQAGSTFSQEFMNQIYSKVSSGALDKAIASVQTKLSKLTTQMNSLGKDAITPEMHTRYAQIQADLERLIQLRNKFFDPTATEAQQIQAYENFNITLKRVQNNLSTATNTARQFASALQVATLDNRMASWLEKNSRASKDFGASINLLRTRLAELQSTGQVTTVQLNSIEGEFNKITTAATAAGKVGTTFAAKFASGFQSIFRYFSSATLIFRAISTIKQMYNNVLEVDTAMTGLKRVTNLSSQEYQGMFESMTASAKKYGATLSDIIDSTTSWVKLGFSSDMAGRLAEITTMYQHVADIDSATATENLVTAYKGFQSSLDATFSGDSAAAIEYIADIFDRLNNEYAVTAADVGDALQRSASSLQLAGNSIQEASALVVGMNEVIQNAEKTGTVLNVTALRLRGMKGQLEELGEDVDENVESISKMQTQVLNLTHGKVNIFNDDGTFKSTYEILKEISEVYNELKDTEQADLLETIAGKRNANGVAALISNFSQAEKALISATNATGTASAENEKYMESMQGKLDAFKASWQALSTNLLNSDFLKGLIDSGRTFLDILNDIVSTTGALPPLLAIISGYLIASKKVGKDKMFSFYKYANSNQFSLGHQSFLTADYEIHNCKRSLNMLGT